MTYLNLKFENNPALRDKPFRYVIALKAGFSVFGKDDMGLCECGCGELTAISKYDCKTRGYKKGHPRRFIMGHWLRIQENNPSWKRGWSVSKNGAIRLHENGVQVFEHRKIISDILGKPIPDKAQGHHIDKNCANNSNNNLVLCEDDSYHKLLHPHQKQTVFYLFSHFLCRP